jgi:hypothetical protein
MTTCRTNFNESWLSETPSGIEKTDLYDVIRYNIQDLKNSGAKVTDLPNNIKKIELSSTVYYWIENNEEILLGIELHKKTQSLIVAVVGKNPKYRRKPPYASELYGAILADSPVSIRIMSDTQLSDEGLSLWKKMVNDGHQVSVYDSDNPGQTFNTIKTSKELDQFFKTGDSKFKRYQYVLSESGMKWLETKSNFNTRRMRELSGFSLED